MLINQVSQTVSLTPIVAVHAQIWQLGIKLVRYLLTFPKSLVIHKFYVVEPVMGVTWCYKIFVARMDSRSEIMTFG